MNTGNLKKGMVVKNYSKMCELLGDKVKSGGAKLLHLQELKRYVEWDMDGNAFVITKKYHKPKALTENKQRQIKINKEKFKTNHPNFKICYHTKDCAGVYIIVLGNTVYIGSTVNFYNRYTQHKSNLNIYPTKELMDNGATFNLLWLYVESEHIDYNDFQDDDVIEDCKKNLKIEIIRKKEIEYIKEFYKNKDIFLINSAHARDKQKIKIETIQKLKLCKIYINLCDFDDAITILEENNIEYKLKK